MSTNRHIIQGAFTSPDNSNGKRPYVFDILGPDQETSLLPSGIRLVLLAGPKNVTFNYAKQIERIQTKGGFVEQHWGDSTEDITFQKTTGGFVRLFTGVSNITNPAYGGTRRDTITYDNYLDLLALYRSNGAIHDTEGNIIFNGILKMTFDEGVYLGWFTSFSVSEATEMPYQFSISSQFEVHKQIMKFKSQLASRLGASQGGF